MEIYFSLFGNNILSIIIINHVFLDTCQLKYPYVSDM